MVVGLSQIRGRPELFAPVGALPPGVMTVEQDASPRRRRGHAHGRHRSRRRFPRHAHDSDEDEEDEEEAFFGMGVGSGGNRSSYDERLAALMENRVLYDEMRRDMHICILGGVALIEGLIILSLLSQRRN